MSFFKQCEMVKKEGMLTWHTTSWIPEELAHIGQKVKLHIQGDVWDYGWVVEKVGTQRAAKDVSAHERDHLTQAKASDMVRDENGRWKKLGD